MVEDMLMVFVYGSLKRGFENHLPYCRYLQSVSEAAVIGKLYGLSAGYPGLLVPGGFERGVGTADALADVALQQRASAAWLDSDICQGESRGMWNAAFDCGWGEVYGELMAFSNVQESLAGLDDLEAYSVGGPCLYRRVLVPVRVADRYQLAWVYVMDEDTVASFAGEYIESGMWRKTTC
ncbi:gamma-glutamylcyclotransferase family protein [Persicirhabdus sediminis]|nr:gamma-glutamylcyclotransferase [Persicirhabdus sediminis]